MKSSADFLSRRRFVSRAFAALAVAGFAPAVISRGAAGKPLPKPRHAVALGGPIFTNAADPDALAAAHRQLGYAAAYCPALALKDTDRIRATETAFARAGVTIAEVGRWVNLLDADADKRRKNLETVTEGLALADAVGARCCVDIAGSFSTKEWYGPHPDNFSAKFFDAAVENARRIIDAVKPRRAKFCYEMMGWALPDTPDAYLKMIKAVDRPAFGVHVDVCNLINSPAKFYRNADVIHETFDKLGRWIVSCHAKDLAWEVEMNVHFREVRPGTGTIDYATYLRRLAALPQTAPLMLEHLPNAQEYDAAREHILKVGRETGVSFG